MQKTLAMAGLAAIALVGSSLATAADIPPPKSAPQPSSYAPQPHSSTHVYGSPIEPPLVGHNAAPHRVNPSQKPAGGAKAAGQGSAAGSSAKRTRSRSTDPRPGPR